MKKRKRFHEIIHDLYTKKVFSFSLLWLSLFWVGGEFGWDAKKIVGLPTKEKEKKRQKRGHPRKEKGNPRKKETEKREPPETC